MEGRAGEKQGETGESLWVKVIQSEGGEGEKLHSMRGGAGVKMRESFLSCLPALASQPVIQSIPQTEASFFSPLPLDVLYLAGVLLQLGIKPPIWEKNKQHFSKTEVQI